MNNLNSPRASAYSPGSRPTVPAAAVLGLLGLLTLGACHGNKEADEKSDAFTLTDTMFERLGFDTVRQTPVQGEIELNGRIVADENRMADIFPIVGGQVLDVMADLGDHVTKGQTLAVIRSSEVADYERQLVDAQSDVRLAEKNAKTQQDLFNSHLVSERELLAAQQDLAKAQAELSRIQEAFTIYHLQEGSQYVVKAPISGYIIDKAITKDVTLPADHDEKIFTIAELDEVWVLADVYESDIARVKEGMPAEVTTLSYPGKVMNGKVDKIFNILDPQTRTMRVRIRLKNDSTMLKPEMIAHVKLVYHEDRSLPCVPSKAVVFDNSRHFVMVFKDRDHIITQEVTPERSANDVTWIADGLTPGEVIVSKEQLFVYDALNDR